MSELCQFTMDLQEQFPHLPGAPIAEAVIHWRARAEKPLEPGKLLEELKRRLPEYPGSQTQQELQVESQISPEGSAHTQRAQWHGFRFESEDKLHIAQFTRNGFVFSRLKPYEDWVQFAAEAQRLWPIYVELAEPSEIQRLGVRFINRIAPVEPDKLAAYLTIPPKAPKQLALPIQGFMHQSRFVVPGHPYNMNVIQTLQPPTPAHSGGFGLILDIDVFTTQAIPLEDESFKDCLAVMRWLKNKAFFTFVTDRAVKRFGEART